MHCFSETTATESYHNFVMLTQSKECNQFKLSLRALKQLQLINYFILLNEDELILLVFFSNLARRIPNS